ncbi:sugar kinase [Marinomonas transparens]|uniref:2-dehydro-3-deoxygluconokinase n=1 Tax=Marinomonas transparens TaxID=2795388 RepID=A0A934JTW8_9GAMM|nr:sugar kinase [Marinomonas transparens]MBJ7537244.1 sugar kinase [Marinomonas transparens]
MSQLAMPTKIALIGECMIQLQGSLFGILTQSWGGDTYNTAVYLRRLLPEQFEVHYITGLGDDALSHALQKAWQSQGLKLDSIRIIEDKRPGLYQITTDSSGERSFHYWRNDAAAKYVFDQMTAEALADELGAFGMVYLSGISLAILTEKGRATLLDALDIYAEGNGKVVFDNNYRPALWPNKETCQAAYRRILAISHIALITEDDDELLWGRGSSEAIFADYDCPEVVIKRGSEDCLLCVENSYSRVPTEPVKNVVDTTAAGDSFGAGYLFGRLMSMDPATSAGYGHELAGRVIQHSGAIIDEVHMPNLS